MCTWALETLWIADKPVPFTYGILDHNLRDLTVFSLDDITLGLPEKFSLKVQFTGDGGGAGYEGQSETVASVCHALPPLFECTLIASPPLRPTD